MAHPVPDVSATIIRRKEEVKRGSEDKPSIWKASFLGCTGQQGEKEARLVTTLRVSDLFFTMRWEPRSCAEFRKKLHPLRMIPKEKENVFICRGNPRSTLIIRPPSQLRLLTVGLHLQRSNMSSCRVRAAQGRTGRYTLSRMCFSRIHISESTSAPNVRPSSSGGRWPARPVNVAYWPRNRMSRQWYQRPCHPPVETTSCKFMKEGDKSRIADFPALEFNRSTWNWTLLSK